MRIAIYSRKSKFTGKGESIENQIEMCENYIKTHFTSENKISIFEDEGFSGKNLNRPMFKLMMEEEYENPFDLIIVYRLDRISRNVGDFSSLIDKLNAFNTSFISIKEQFDTSTPMGRAMMNIAAVFAQLERETIAERIKDNMYMLAKTGRWLGGTTPFGFSSKKVVGEDKKSYYKLIINEEELNIIKLIFSKYLEYRSMNKLVTYLINHDIKTRKNCNFSVTTIKKILTNPVYCTADKYGFKYFYEQGCNLCCNEEECDGEYGFIGYAKTQVAQSKDKISDRIINELPKWIISIGEHQGIIDGKSFVEVQEQLALNIDKGIRFKQSHNPVALLSGVIICKCGSYMRPKYYRENKDGTKPYVYMCELKEKSKSEKCKCSNVNGAYIDNKICELLLNYEADDNIFNKHILNIKYNTDEDNIIDSIREYESKKIEKRKEIESLIKVLTCDLNDATLKYVNKEIEALNQNIQSIDKEITLLKATIEANKKSKENINNITESLKFFKNNFDNLSIENKRNFIKKCIKQIVWDGTDIHIFTKSL
ncbi:recombinase family protein [Porcipelethomonas sp.]|uniref:recombinase family protein n=1 Tax=Porcipelethomonas sp. TaxID=2981675 RepID=UPI003EF0D24D